MSSSPATEGLVDGRRAPGQPCIVLAYEAVDSDQLRRFQSWSAPSLPGARQALGLESTGHLAGSLDQAIDEATDWHAFLFDQLDLGYRPSPLREGSAAKPPSPRGIRSSAWRIGCRGGVVAADLRPLAARVCGRSMAGTCWGPAGPVRSAALLAGRCADGSACNALTPESLVGGERWPSRSDFQGGQYPAVRPGNTGIGCGRPVAQRRARPGPGRQ